MLGEILLQLYNMASLAPILVCVDSFKGSLSSQEVAKACREGIRLVLPDAIVASFALADGGEGSVDAIRLAIGGKTYTINVDGPLGESIAASYLISNDGTTAFIEMAAAAGLTLIEPQMLNPMETSTYGVGQLIADARTRGCRRFVVGIGGSATNDGGTGMLQALGFRFLDTQGHELGRGGKILSHIASIVAPPQIVYEGEEFIVMCDVDNPLTGPLGASAMFGPQKGATTTMVAELDNGLRNYARIISQMGLGNVDSLPGAGAAGGLGAAFRAFFNARLSSGVDIILELNGFKEALSNASLVITGEGSIDEQTLHGKAPSGVLKAAKQHNVPVIAIAGHVDSVQALNDAGFLAVLPIVAGPCTLKDAITKSTARANIVRTVAQAIHLWNANR